MLTTNLNYSLELQQNWDWETNTADLHVNACRGTCKKHALIGSWKYAMLSVFKNCFW